MTMTVEKAQALLDGATPGPWLANGEPWNLIVWSAADNRVCFMAHSNGLDDDRDVATAELVAAAPDLARAYIAQAAELIRQSQPRTSPLFWENRMTLTLEEAIAIAKSSQAEVGLVVLEGDELTGEAIKAITNAVASADLIPRTDAEQAVAAAYELTVKEVECWLDEAEWPETRRGLTMAILALAPADALAEVERMRAELREAWMQSLSDLGQAQDAWEAQKAAEAEVARLKDAIPPLIVIALDNLDGMNAETRAECEADIANARVALKGDTP